MRPPGVWRHCGGTHTHRGEGLRMRGAAPGQFESAELGTQILATAFLTAFLPTILLNVIGHATNYFKTKQCLGKRSAIVPCFPCMKPMAGVLRWRPHPAAARAPPGAQAPAVCAEQHLEWAAHCFHQYLNYRGACVLVSPLLELSVFCRLLF